MTTPNPAQAVTNNRHPAIRWTPAVLSVATAAGLFAAGIILLLQAALPQNIPASAVPASVAVPHDLCSAMPKWNTVPRHAIGIPRRDVRNLALITQDFAHRQGGCYYHDGSTRHRITLPEPAILEVLELNRGNYDQWADGRHTTSPTAVNADLHQIDLYIKVEKYDNGFALAFVGWIGLMVAMGVCFETAETDLQRRRQAKLSACHS